MSVEVQRDHRFASGSRGGPGSALNDGQLMIVQSGDEAVQLVPRGAAQQVADEQAVPGQFGHHAHVQPVRRVGAGVKVLHE